MIFFKILINVIFYFFVFFKSASASFFNDITDLIENNYESLRYGISVADVNDDGAYEFIVAGFGSENLALSYKNNRLVNINILFNLKPIIMNHGKKKMMKKKKKKM